METTITQLALGMSNAFLVRGERTLLVDTGCAGLDALEAACRAQGAALSDISLLIITHGHADHFADAAALKARTGIPLLCHRQAFATLSEGRMPAVTPRGPLGERLFLEAAEHPPLSSVAAVMPDILASGNMDLRPYGVRARLMETPGHSACSYSLVTGGREAIVGDIVAASPADGTLVPAWFAYDEALLLESIERVLALADTLYSGHGGPFTAADVRAALAREGIK